MNNFTPPLSRWPAVSTARRAKLRWDFRVEKRRAPLFDASASSTTSWQLIGHFGPRCHRQAKPKTEIEKSYIRVGMCLVTVCYRLLFMFFVRVWFLVLPFPLLFAMFWKFNLSIQHLHCMCIHSVCAAFWNYSLAFCMICAAFGDFNLFYFAWSTQHLEPELIPSIVYGTCSIPSCMTFQALWSFDPPWYLLKHCDTLGC